MSSEPPINVWDYKPWWCQPWSIVLTGLVIIAGSWLLSHHLWVTLLVSLPVLTWMGYFVLLYPRLVAQAYSASSIEKSVNE